MCFSLFVRHLRGIALGLDLPVVKRLFSFRVVNGCCWPSVCQSQVIKPTVCYVLCKTLGVDCKQTALEENGSSGHLITRLKLSEGPPAAECFDRVTTDCWSALPRVCSPVGSQALVSLDKLFSVKLESRTLCVSYHSSARAVCFPEKLFLLYGILRKAEKTRNSWH